MISLVGPIGRPDVLEYRLAGEREGLPLYEFSRLLEEEATGLAGQL